jgi:hypothetical protein
VVGRPSFRDASFLSVLVVRLVMARYENAVPELEVMGAIADGPAGGATERKGVGLVLQRHGGCDSRWRRGGASTVVSVCILGGLWAPLGCRVDDRVPSVVAPTASDGSDGSNGSDGSESGVTGAGGDARVPRDASEPSARNGATGGSGGDIGTSETAERDASTAACSEPCPPGSSCTGGTCQCPGSLAACPDGCIDLQTDREHCGDCTTRCSDGCAAGFCFNQIVAPVVSAPDRYQIALDATHVYFTQRLAGTVSRVSQDGTLLQVLAVGQLLPTSIAVDANRVYWTAQGSLLSMPLAGGTPVELTPSPEPDTSRLLGDIAVNATHVFWTESPGSIARVPLEGGLPTVIASGDGVGPVAMAIDDTHVYWANFESANISVMKTPLDGGTVTVLASGLDRVRDIAVYGGQVYFVINGESVQSVARVGSGGGPVATLGANHATCISVDSTGVYIGGAGQYQNGVVRYPLDGEGERVLGGGAFFSDSIALGTNTVFWSSALDGIRSTAKVP